MADGDFAVDVICAFEKRKGKKWHEVEGDPHRHYLFLGPLGDMDDELWEIFGVATSDSHQKQVKAAIAQGEKVESTLTVYCGTYDRYYLNSDLNAATAWSMDDPTLYYTGDTIRIGQRHDGSTYYYQAMEGNLGFGTSALGAGVTVSAATLSLWGYDNQMNVGYPQLQARAASGYGVMTPAQLTAATLLATRNSSAGWSTSGYNAFTSTASMPGAINRTGVTYFMLCTDDLAAGSSYGTGGWNSYASCYSANYGGRSPKLVITYATTPPPEPPSTIAVGNAVDYDDKTFWPTTIVSDAWATPGKLLLACEEGVCAEDRGLCATGKTPAVGAYYDYQIPVPTGGLRVPAGLYSQQVPYQLPTGSTLSVKVSLVIDGVEGTEYTQALPVTAGAVSTFGVQVTQATAAVAATSLVVRTEVTVYSAGGGAATLYPIPVDLVGTAPCGHFGLATGQSSITEWERATPVIVLESPPAGSHADPTLLSGPPIVKLTCDSLYPNDVVTVKAYADPARDNEHSPVWERVQVDSAVVQLFTASVMPFGSMRRYVEIGDAPYQLTPPDVALDNAPGVVAWIAGHNYHGADKVVPTHPWPRYYQQLTGGVSGSSEPVWPSDGNSVEDGTCLWEDLGDRYSYHTNTYYVLTVTSAMGTLFQTIAMEALLDTGNPVVADQNIAPPQIISVPDCDTETEVILKVKRGTAYENDPNPMEVEIELIGPDGTTHAFRPGVALEQYIGRLTAS
jgi:hypothetical protein